jgi:hypothetical protein
MPTIIAILIIVVGVINMCRLLPQSNKQEQGTTGAPKEMSVQQ